MIEDFFGNNFGFEQPIVKDIFGGHCSMSYDTERDTFYSSQNYSIQIKESDDEYQIQEGQYYQEEGNNNHDIQSNFNPVFSGYENIQEFNTPEFKDTKKHQSVLTKNFLRDFLTPFVNSKKVYKNYQSDLDACNISIQNYSKFCQQFFKKGKELTVTQKAVQQLLKLKKQNEVYSEAKFFFDLIIKYMNDRFLDIIQKSNESQSFLFMDWFHNEFPKFLKQIDQMN